MRRNDKQVETTGMTEWWGLIAGDEEPGPLEGMERRNWGRAEHKRRKPLNIPMEFNSRK